jgi:hypothetical protein
LLQALKNYSFQLSLAYLADAFEALNHWTWSFKGQTAQSLLIMI